MNNQNDNQTNKSTSDQDVLKQYASTVKDDTQKVDQNDVLAQEPNDTSTDQSVVKMSEAPKTTPNLDPPFVDEPLSSKEPVSSPPPQSTEAITPETKESLKDYNAVPLDAPPTPTSLSDNLQASKSLKEDSSSVTNDNSKKVSPTEITPESQPVPNPETTPEPEITIKPGPPVESKAEITQEPEIKNTSELNQEPKIEITSDPEVELKPESKIIREMESTNTPEPNPQPTIQTETNSVNQSQEDPEKIKQKIEDVLSYNTANSVVDTPPDKPKTSRFLKTLFIFSLITFIAISAALAYFYFNPTSKIKLDFSKKPTETPTPSGIPTQSDIVCELNGFVYNLNQSFPAADGCNTCTCVSADNIKCTDNLCSGTTTIPATSSSIPKDWKSFISKELGLSFAYPISWGEPEINKEDYNSRTANGAFDGKYFSIYFKNYGAINGYTKNYSNYTSGSYYVGDKANLDEPDKYSTKSGDIYFTKKNTVANQKTSTKTALEYLPEAGGAIIISRTYLNGKTEYTGIVIIKYYPSLDKKIEPLYTATEPNETLEKEAIVLINGLKENTSTDKEAQTSYDQYQAWLKSFKQI